MPSQGGRKRSNEQGINWSKYSMDKVILDTNYIAGMRDARDGKPAQSTHPNYERAYSAQYQLQQITQGMNNELKRPTETTNH